MTVFPPVKFRHVVEITHKPYVPALSQKAIGWISLGILQLLSYRILYNWYYIPAENVHNLITFVGHTSINYLLLLRWSGIILIAIGLLKVIGFHLPVPFNNYFLATGFNDFLLRFYLPFRRFLIDIFYKRTFATIARWSTLPAREISVLSLFFIAWMLHNAQWYLFHNHFPLRIVDFIFWSLLASFVFIEWKYTKSRVISNLRPEKFFQAWMLSFKIICTFTAMSLLYSLASAHSLQGWMGMVKLASASPLTQWLHVGAAVVFIGCLLSIGLYVRPILSRRFEKSRTTSKGIFSLWPIIALSILLCLQMPTLATWTEASYSLHLRKILMAGRSKSDALSMAGGYYSELVSPTRLIDKESENNPFVKENFESSPCALAVNDFRILTLRPNCNFIFKTKQFKTNDKGFRDKSYPNEPPLNTIRSIFLGSSFVVGAGVADSEVFDQILEDRMNNTNSEYEFINAGCSTYDLINCMVRFDADSLHLLQPDYLFIVSHGLDIQKNIKDIAIAIRAGIPLPYSFLTDLVSESGVTPDMSEFRINQSLQPYGHKIIQLSYELLYKKCIDNGIQPVWVYWPTISMRPTMDLETDTIYQIIASTGFEIIDLKDVYLDHDPSLLYVASYDRHPNALGHLLVAEEFYRIFHSSFPLKKQR